MKKIWIFGVVTIVALLVCGGLAFLYNLPFDDRDRAPLQPIAFSHKVHAGENGIHCLFCHRTAPDSTVAGIPAVSTCRSCHLFISPDTPEVKKIMAYWDKRQPIPWNRVYAVPDHVYFPHMMHIRAGLDCRECHGDVASMERVEREVSIKMGWCMGCHRSRGASIDCWTCHK